MKDSEIYLRAAELIEVNKHDFLDICGYSCIAIGVAQYDFRGRYALGGERSRYERIFKPNPKMSSLSAWGDAWGNNNETRKNCRILALLFMHEIAKDSEKARGM